MCRLEGVNDYYILGSIMHPLLREVIDQRDLSKAGDLFTIGDWEILSDLPTVLVKLKAIFRGKYEEESDEQIVAEMCVTRVTAAIRETNTIGTYAPYLVDLLQSCIEKRATDKRSDKEEGIQRAKIVSDILSCLFLNFEIKPVMTIAIPVAVKILAKGGADLVRSTSSYLALATIHNAALVARHALNIIQSIKLGNSFLIRVLSHIYPENKEPFHVSLSQLLDLLDKSQKSEKLALLQLFCLIAESKPEVLLPHLHKFKSFLFTEITCSAVLGIYCSLIERNYTPHLSQHMNALKKAGDIVPMSQAPVVARVIAHIGRLNKASFVFSIRSLICNFYAYRNRVLMIPIVFEILFLAEEHPEAVSPYAVELLSIVEEGPVAAEVVLKVKAICRNAYGCTGEKPRHITNRSNKSGNVVKPILHNPVGLVSAPARSPPVANHSCEQITPMHDLKFCNESTSLPKPPTGMSKVASRSRSAHNLLLSRRADGKLDKDQITRAQQLEQIRQELPAPAANDGSSVYGSKTNLLDEDAGKGVMWLSKKTRFGATTKQVLGAEFGCSVVFVRPRQPLSNGHRFNVSGAQSAPVGRKHRISKMTNRLLVPFQADHPSSDNSARSAEPPFTSPLNRAAVSPSEKQSSILSQIRNSSIGFESLSGGGSVGPQMTDACTQSSGTLQSSVYPIDQGEDQEKTVAVRGYDAVQQFCEKHKSKIYDYINAASAKHPIPCLCTVEEIGRRQCVRIHFCCQERGPYCLRRENFFDFKTKRPHLWIHLMFLHLQEQLELQRELQNARYHDLFVYNLERRQWCCFACNYPERVQYFLQETNCPVIEGQLQAKKGRWKFLKRWTTKYFTLSSASLSYRPLTSDSHKCPPIELRSIRSVKSLNSRKGRRMIPKAFEIFTDRDCSYMLKAKHSKNAEEWFQCLQIAIAQVRRDPV
ncbi:Protein melted [Trichuris trichiura]|uniref:Protein melted n=1 Tax=Trichuris trichiura TaxID=36087 RepID=A0A077YVG5_TRITR|nr:Protein melted [Trichuris trichiura]